MSLQIFFLSADVRMTKSFSMEDGKLKQTAYPNAYKVTNHKEEIKNIVELHKAITAHAAKAHCLVKGIMHEMIIDASRAGLTKTDDETNWLCLDLDDAPFKTHNDFVRSIPALSQCSYIMQHSASAGIVKKPGTLSAHLFFMLDGTIKAPLIKQWLLEQNLNVQQLKEALTLSTTGAALHFPLDITACQNDKLLYIAPPTLKDGVHCTLKDSERIQLIPGKMSLLPASLLQTKESFEQLKEKERALKNALRKAANLQPLRSQTVWEGNIEIQPKPGVSVITGSYSARGFTYFNLNHSTSWPYYHPDDNPEYIHNFRGEPIYRTKDLLPDYWKDIKQAQQKAQAQPTTTGDIILAFCDRDTAEYHRGVYHPESRNVKIHKAKNEKQLTDWMLGHGLTPYTVIPVWEQYFNPTTLEVVDDVNKRINTYTPTKWLNAEYKPTPLATTPLIRKIIMSAVSGNEENETLEHFLNWLAVIFQHRIKTTTAWVLQGTEGTGKGVLAHYVLKPLLNPPGKSYVEVRKASDLEEKFTGWLQDKLIVAIDEIQLGGSKNKEPISADLRNFITEPECTHRYMNRMPAIAPSFVNFMFFSNKRDHVVINDQDRRYNIGIYQNERLILTNEQIHKEIPKELPAFMRYIMTRNADINTAAQNLKNEAHQITVETSRTSIDSVVNQLANGDLMALWDSRPDMNLIVELYGANSAFAHAYVNILKREIRQMFAALTHTKPPRISTTESKLTRDELLIIFEHCVGNMPRTPNKFTSLLKHRHIHTKRMRINEVITYGLEVEWKAETTWLKERMAEIDAIKPALTRVK